LRVVKGAPTRRGIPSDAGGETVGVATGIRTLRDIEEDLRGKRGDEEGKREDR